MRLKSKPARRSAQSEMAHVGPGVKVVGACFRSDQMLHGLGGQGRSRRRVDGQRKWNSVPRKSRDYGRPLSGRHHPIPGSGVRNVTLHISTDHLRTTSFPGCRRSIYRKTGSVPIPSFPDDLLPGPAAVPGAEAATRGQRSEAVVHHGFRWTPRRRMGNIAMKMDASV